ncbi:hypothetical protein [Enterococcus gilvus]|uniref:hypothetical protein n=1 Tax=Enterococcus gilvus TaxID=160453 RepID=UPI002907F0A1|nr:hypothetical protein [Enterococcus gilvus]MDU5511931.1 hypothetical protein [Enterococcus gilvus]
MPRSNKKRPSADFETAFDDDLDAIETPEDSLEFDTSDQYEADPEEEVQIVENTSSNSQAQKFGLTAAKESDSVESINKTYKLNEYTVRKLDSLIHKDNKNSKKLAGTKGFLSDFLENAIWQHFYQLGLIDEDEANEHIKDYGKYPLNVENFKNIKK